jgi:hypothetical protein
MKKSIFALLFAFAAPLLAQGGTGVNIGVGTRAFAFSGNHTAVVNDLSAVYWNPAAMAFLPVREFQASFDLMRTNGKSEVTGSDVSSLPGAKMSDYRDRLRLRGLGAMFAIPTSQGGLTLALSYDNPFAFDDFSVYGYSYGDVEITENDLRYGGLNRWSGAFGVQVAPEIAAGLTISLIAGDDKTIFDQRIDGNYYNDMELDYSYLGYSLNGGLLYIPSDYLRIGFNLNMMMYLGVSEDMSGRLYQGEKLQEYPPLDGRAYRAPYGAIGVGVTLPWLIVALDFRFVMPYGFILPGEKIPEDSQARDFKVGAGIGLEAPLPVAPVVLRAGYSFDECDYYPIVNKLDGEGINWSADKGFSTIRNKHSLTLGAAVFTSGTGFELSYGYQTWGISHENKERALKQMYSSHQAMAAIIFRY